MEQGSPMRDIQELNLSYLILAQGMLRQSRAEGMYRLGIGEEVAEILLMLTPAQISRLASSPVLLCRFRLDDHVLLSALTNEAPRHDLQHLHASIWMAAQPVADAMVGSHA
jgi:flagellar transcriptional activator FlhD